MLNWFVVYEDQSVLTWVYHWSQKFFLLTENEIDATI